MTTRARRYTESKPGSCGGSRGSSPPPTPLVTVGWLVADGRGRAGASRYDLLRCQQLQLLLFYDMRTVVTIDVVVVSEQRSSASSSGK